MKTWASIRNAEVTQISKVHMLKQVGGVIGILNRLFCCTAEVFMLNHLQRHITRSIYNAGSWPAPPNQIRSTVYI